jgi:formate hydrogenlyase subunit 4
MVVVMVIVMMVIVIVMVLVTPYLPVLRLKSCLNALNGLRTPYFHDIMP